MDVFRIFRKKTNHKIRAIRVALDKPLTPKYVQRALIPILVEEGYNSLLIDISENLDNWSYGEIIDVESACKENGIALIPEYNFSSNMMSQIGLCDVLVEKIVFLFDPYTIHVGFDKVRFSGQKNHSNCLFWRQNEVVGHWSEGAKWLYDKLKSMKISMWVWGDIVSNGFSSCEIPKDIVVCVGPYNSPHVFNSNKLLIDRLFKLGFNIIMAFDREMIEIKNSIRSFRKISSGGIIVNTSRDMLYRLESFERYIRVASRSIFNR